jgi:hypothetical protein
MEEEVGPPPVCALFDPEASETRIEVATSIHHAKGLTRSAFKREKCQILGHEPTIEHGMPRKCYWKRERVEYL